MNQNVAAALLQLVKQSYLEGKQDGDGKYALHLSSFQLSDLEELLEEQVYD